MYFRLTTYCRVCKKPFVTEATFDDEGRLSNVWILDENRPMSAGDQFECLGCEQDYKMKYGKA